MQEEQFNEPGESCLYSRHDGLCSDVFAKLKLLRNIASRDIQTLPDYRSGLSFLQQVLICTNSTWKYICSSLKG